MYEIDSYHRPRIWIARMRVVVPDYSSHYYENAVKAMKYELDNLGVELLEPEYIYITADDIDRDDCVDLKINIGVKKPGTDTSSLEFIYLDDSQEVIRIRTESFDDIHIGLAEWMHENDYEADGSLRRVLHEEDFYIYDCPIKKV